MDLKKMKSTDSYLQQKRTFREGYPNDTTTLQDMPLEILDMILMKAALFPMKTSKKSRLCPPVDLIQEPIQLLMTVWSEWCCRLNTKWFKIKFCREITKSNSLLWKTISLDQAQRVITGFTKLRNKIYVLSCEPSSIHVYEDHGCFSLIDTISMSETIPIVCGIHSNPRTDCLFVLEAVSKKDHFAKTIWKMDAEGKDVTKWMEDNENEIQLSVAEEGNVIITKQPAYSRRMNNNTHGVRIEIYRSDATLISGFNFSCRVFDDCVESMRRSSSCGYKMISSVIHTQQDYLIISYKYIQMECCVSTDYATAVIQVDMNGKVISALSSALSRPIGVDEVDIPMPTKEWTRYFFHYPSFLFVDEKRRLLFVTSYTQNTIFVFDTNSLKWIETIRLHEEPSMKISRDNCRRGRGFFPIYFVSEELRAFPIHFDSEKRQLLVRNCNTNHIEVYRMLQLECNNG